MKLSVLQKGIIVLVVGGASYLLAVFAYLSPPVVALDVMHDLDLTQDSMGLMFAVTILGYALMQPVAGFCADYFGPRRCLLVATFLLGLGLLLFSYTQGLGVGIATRATVGLAAGLTLLPCLKLAGNWFSPKYFGLISSIIIAFSAIGYSLSGRPLVMLTSEFGWRATFSIIGVLGIIWTVVVFSLVQDKPKGLAVGQDVYYTNEGGQSPPSIWEAWSTILKIPSFWLLGFLYIGTDLIYCTISALWLGPYLIEAYGQPEALVGNMITLAAVSYFIGPPLLALWGGVWSYSKVILVVAFVNVGLISFFVISPDIPGVWVLYVLCFLAPIGAQVTGLILALGRNLAPERIGGSAMGLLNFFPLLGGAIMQQVVGKLLTVGEVGSTNYDVRGAYGLAFTPILIYMVLAIFLAIWQVKLENKSKLHA